MGFTLGLLCLNALAGSLMVTGDYARDDFLGEIRKSGTVALWRIEGNGTSHWLDGGLRSNGNEPRTSGGPKILVLGDSFTEALNVNDTETYVSIAERSLRSDGFQVDLLNSGLASRSVADYVFHAKVFQDRFHPAWTVLLVQEDDFTDDAWNADKNHFVLAPDGALQVVRPSAESPGSMSVYDKLIKKFKHACYRIHMNLFWEMGRRRLAFLERAWNAQPELFWAATPRLAEATPVYPLQEELVRLKQVYGGRFTLVFFADFHPPEPGKLSPIQAQLQTLCRNEAIDFLDLAQEDKTFLDLGVSPRGFANTAYNQGHWNTVGHEVAGRRVGQHLEEMHRHGVF